MAPVSFENNYDDFTIEIATNILNKSGDGISKIFAAKLENFKNAKIQLLNDKMQKDLFHDETVYTGCSGFALYYLMLGIRKADNYDLLKTAWNYVNISKLKGRRISFLCGDAGPLAIAAVISYKLRTKRPDTLPDYTTLVQKLLSLNTLLKESPAEMLNGKSGYLFALLFVISHIPEDNIIPPSYIEKVIAAIINSGQELATELNSDSPMLWQWHEKCYYGAAHGMAGILYMLLQARDYITINYLNNLVQPTIDWLLSQRFPSGNFPSSMGSTSGDRLVQWCHGAPGFISLCILSAQVFDEDKYLKIAEESCECIWQRGLCTKGYSICHGVSGNAYGFLQMYQHTKDPKYLYRACCFLDWCIAERHGTEFHRPDRPASLFEGLVGRLYLAEDIKDLANCKFPAFTV